jgi:hypothetical protein
MQFQSSQRAVEFVRAWLKEDAPSLATRDDLPKGNADDE